MKTAIKKRSEWIKIRNIAHKNLLFFGYCIHPHQKLLTKKKRVLFVDENFNFSLFSLVLRIKNSMPIPFPWSFWLDMCKCMTKQVCLHIKNWKTSGNETTKIHVLNPRLEENLKLYKKLAKKRFLNSNFWISHFILNLIPRVSCLDENSFDGNKGFLCGQH